MSNKRKMPAKSGNVNTPAEQASLFDVLPAPIIAMPLDAGPSTAEMQADAERRIKVLPGEPSRVVKRLISTREEISSAMVDERDYQHTCMAQISLPYSRPKDDVRVWDKFNGAASMRIFAGVVQSPDGDKWQEVSLPYGAKARLVLVYLNTIAKKTCSPVIDIGESMTGFIKGIIGRDPNSRDIASVKDQLIALSAAKITIAMKDKVGATILHTSFIDEFDIKFSGPNKIIWPERVMLNDRYFQSLERHAIPLDHRAIRSLAHNALALDIYVWLAQRLHRIERESLFLTWATLKEQFGSEYAHMFHFRDKFREALTQVRAVYPAARISDEENERGGPLGLRLFPSPPPVNKFNIALIEG